MTTVTSFESAAAASPVAVLRRFAVARPDVSAFILLLVWTCLVRLPFLHILHDDEGFYSAVASRWLRGELPYVSSFDVKAPGIFAAFAVIQAVFGVSLYVIKGTEIVFTALGGFGLYRLLARHGSMRAARLAAFLYPVYSLTLMSMASPCQILQATATIWGFVWVADAATVATRAQRLMFAALGGLAIGCAVTLKQTAAFEGAGLFAWMVWQALRRREVAPLMAFMLAGAAPTLAFVGYFAAAGHLADLYRDTVTIAWQRSQLPLPPRLLPWYLEAPRRIGLMPGLVFPIITVTCGVALAALRRQRLRRLGVASDLGLVWYVAAVAGLLINREPEAWYVTTLVAPSLVLFCLVLCEGVDFPSSRRFIWLALLTALAAVQPLIGMPQALMADNFSGEPDYLGAKRTAEALKAAGARPGDNMLVISRGHYIYVMSGTLPKSRYFNAMHLLCDFPVPDADSIETSFAARPTYVVLSDPSVAIACAQVTRMRRVKAHLAYDYDLMTTVHGRWDSFNLYRRKPGI